MDVTSVTVGVAVTDLAASVAWYQQVLELGAPDLQPVDGVVEFAVGGVWLQLTQGRPTHDAPDTVLRLGVADVAREHDRLRRLGVVLDPLETVPGVISYVDFVDPDQNRLGLYELLE